jgi:uncharacterized membrane protein YdjX (TVP38/TMEM64 family)
VAFLLVATAAAIYALGLWRYFSWQFVRTHLSDLEFETRQHPVLGVLAFFVTYVLVTAFSIPVATVLSLLAGALFGRWLGTALAVLAATLGATIAFLSSRYLFRTALERRMSARLETIIRGVERDGAYYLFTLRLLAAVPFFIINLGMGLTRIPIPTFSIVSLLGMLPATFLYVNAGRELSQVTTPGEILSPTVLLSLALLGLVPLALRLLVRGRRLRKPSPSRPAGERAR